MLAAIIPKRARLISKFNLEACLLSSSLAAWLVSSQAQLLPDVEYVVTKSGLSDNAPEPSSMILLLFALFMHARCQVA